MSQVNGIRLGWETERVIAAGSTSGSYTIIGIPFDNIIRQISIQNGTDGDMKISFDGINDHLTLLAGGAYVNDATSNKTISEGLFSAINSAVYVKQITVPTTGSVYVSAYYGSN